MPINAIQTTPVTKAIHLSIQEQEQRVTLIIIQINSTPTATVTLLQEEQYKLLLKTDKTGKK